MECSNPGRRPHQPPRITTRMRCQDCGAPCQASVIVCPFCGFEVGLQRVSDRQRLLVLCLMPVVRGLILLFVLLLVLSGGQLSNFASLCLGNISG